MSGATSPAVGIIGTGLLGSALAERLLRAGFPLTAFDVDDTRLRELTAKGAEAASDAASVATTCRRLLLCLPDSAAVAEVVAAIEASLQGGAVVIDTTTGDPEATVAIARRLAGRGAGYVDATVSGSSAQAREGRIVIMAGGADADFRAAEDLLAALAARVFRMGPAGSGARMKLVSNLVLGLNRAVLAEGLSLARACGIDAAAALDVLRSGAAYSAAMDAKGSKMIAGDFAPQARLAQHHKDVELILQLAARHGARVPLSEAHQRLLANAIQRGYGSLDNSAVIKAYD